MLDPNHLCATLEHQARLFQSSRTNIKNIDLISCTKITAGPSRGTTPKSYCFSDNYHTLDVLLNFIAKTWGFPKMVVPNSHGVFLLNMIILGCEMGVPPFKETPIWWNATSSSSRALSKWHRDQQQLRPTSSRCETPRHWTWVEVTGFSYEPRKNHCYFALYWLVDRDPYNGLL